MENNSIVTDEENIQSVLEILNNFSKKGTIYVVSKDNKLIGSITDGDVRRGLMRNLKSFNLKDVMNNSPVFFYENSIDTSELLNYRNSGYTSIPILNKEGCLVNIIDFEYIKSIIPVEVLLMAGGLGSRLKPLTNKTPKPLLSLNGKPIIDYTVDSLLSYGITKFHISVNYLGEQIERHFEKKVNHRNEFKIVWENNRLGTIGAAGLIDEINTDYLLISNSDILTKIDYESFYIDCVSRNADMSIIGVPYKIKIPYGVLIEEGGNLKRIDEKPIKTYHSSGGIYLIRKEMLQFIPKNKYFDATDLISSLIKNKKKIVTYKTNEFWLDIGKIEDFEYAKTIIKDFNK
jgi:dTDP-glucose pyrophosphorylase